MSIIRKIRKNFLKVELLISILIILIIFIVSLGLGLRETLIIWILSKRMNIYPTIATIGGTLLGFVITGVSIILAFSDSKSKKMKKLKESKHYETIFKVYFSTIKYLAITTITAIIGIIVIKEMLVLLSFYILVWFILISSLRLWRCLWILEKIVEIIS